VRGRWFDSFVIVDWSAAARPARGRDSIWIACLDGDDTTPTVTNPPTRAAAVHLLRAMLSERTDQRVLVGVDFPLGCPAGLVAALGGDRWDDLWALLADRLHDDERNGNDRFRLASELNAALGAGPGPFWGCPTAQAGPTLSTRKVHAIPSPTPTGDLAEFRLTEARLRAAGRRPFSVWQLLGVGSVGSQLLVGLPALQRLRLDPDLGPRVRVWPFETGLDPGLAPDPDADLGVGTEPGSSATVGAPIVIAEVWPSLLPLDPTHHPVKDAAQVIGLAAHLAALDRGGGLAELFAPQLTADEHRRVVGEEGWILGVT
jgi:precorrin-8X/cobalt-precorrin-8 methylmutase